MSTTIPWYACAIPYVRVSGADGQVRSRRVAKVCTLNAAITFLMNGEIGPIEDLMVELQDGTAQWCGAEIERLFVDSSRPPPLDHAKPI